MQRLDGERDPVLERPAAIFYEASVSDGPEEHQRDVDELVENGVAGSFEQARDRLGRLAEVGTTRVYLQVLDLADLDHLADVHAALTAPPVPA